MILNSCWLRWCYNQIWIHIYFNVDRKELMDLIYNKTEIIFLRRKLYSRENEQLFNYEKVLNESSFHNNAYDFFHLNTEQQYDLPCISLFFILTYSKCSTTLEKTCHFSFIYFIVEQDSFLQQTNLCFNFMLLRNNNEIFFINSYYPCES